MAFSFLQVKPLSLSIISTLILESYPPILIIIKNIEFLIIIISSVIFALALQQSLDLPPNIIFVMIVIGCVGAGAFGKVYKVRVEGQLFALKKIPLQFDCKDDDPDLQSLKNEASLLSQLVYHPNVVRCYQSFTKNDFFNIVMEYVGHHSLDDLPLPLRNEKQIINLIIQIAMGLKHLKNNKIIHRDIKPNNILISEKGLLKIADFGISKQLKSVIQAKTCLGTPYYAAPEIINEQKYDYSVDIWSFGVVLYELLHGNLPFLGKNMNELRSRIKFTFPEVRKDIHPDIKLIIRGCLSKDPLRRISVQHILNIPLIKEQMKEDLTRNVKYF